MSREDRSAHWGLGEAAALRREALGGRQSQDLPFAATAQGPIATPDIPRTSVSPTGRPPKLAAGSMVGNYRLVRRLGAGSMSVVFEATNVKTGARAALKCLRPHIARERIAVKRFLGEAIAAGSIGHDGIAAIYDWADDFDGIAYLAMEYLEGETLKARLDRCGRLRGREALSIARQLADTLSAVHAAGIVHRDLKPDNVYLLGDPASPGAVKVKLIDFGVAKFSASSVKMSMNTKAGQILGTPCYMSPEQGRGDKDIDTRSDVYSLGCILYHMLCGLAPFSGTLGELLVAHQFESPRSIRDIDDGLPVELEKLVTAMLSKDRGARPETMAIVGEAIDSIRGTPSARSLATRARPAKPERVGRLGRAVLTVLLCVFVVVASAAATHAAAVMGLL